MNIRQTTRIARRAGALTVAAAGLLLGAPAMASADSGTTPPPHVPKVSDANQQGCSACMSPLPAKPVITDPVTAAGTLTSNTGSSGSIGGGQHLTFSGSNWAGSIPGSSEAVTIDVYASGGGHLVSAYTFTDAKGNFDHVTTSCVTIPRFTTDAYAIAHFDSHPEVQSAPMQITIATDSKGNYVC